MPYSNSKPIYGLVLNCLTYYIKQNLRLNKTISDDNKTNHNPAIWLYIEKNCTSIRTDLEWIEELYKYTSYTTTDGYKIITTCPYITYAKSGSGVGDFANGCVWQRKGSKNEFPIMASTCAYSKLCIDIHSYDCILLYYLNMTISKF